jgi:hypothetical protein
MEKGGWGHGMNLKGRPYGGIRGSRSNRRGIEKSSVQPAEPIDNKWTTSTNA